MLSLDEFRSEVREVLGVDILGEVGPDEELDSLQAYELLVATELLADCAVPTETPEISTLAEAFAYYRRLRTAETPEP